MNEKPTNIFVGQMPLISSQVEIRGHITHFESQPFYCIENYDQMPPFFMSLVSASDHWMFLSSTGGLTAGRMNAESALFPYETDDKVSEHFEYTGSKTLIHLTRNDKTWLWEPFSNRNEGIYHIQRNLYKNLYGTQLIFEEKNLDLNCVFRYSWRTSDQYGFIKTSTFENSSAIDCAVNILDGLEYILPYGIRQETQNIFSNLLDAYKRSELEPESYIGIFTLSSTLTDMAEASESLKATTSWQIGLQPEIVLLSSTQIDKFRHGKNIQTEFDLRGRRGAYFVQSEFPMTQWGNKTWHFILDVNQEIQDIVRLKDQLTHEEHKPELLQKITEDINKGDLALEQLVASSDGLQCAGDEMVNAHHFANTLFNIMRGGVFVENYYIYRNDFLAFIDDHNRKVKLDSLPVLQALPEKFTLQELIETSNKSGSSDLLRLSYEYLPLIFSRRHGDPSRPWNKFSINLKKPDGSRKLDYQGNWRDIFQNWEPLAVSYPEFVESMIFKFLNATTSDGYNPYRLTHSGFDWEIPNPEDPWGNIGYWGDHQIIYLEKLLELSQQFHPGMLSSSLTNSIFVHANVPYRIKPFKEILKDWHNTIDFDWKEQESILERVNSIGSDGKLLADQHNQIIHVNLFEKLLNLLLAKMVNFIPDGGIWMNTQRPEWNDGNNALAGKGISVVTTAYLYRYVKTLQQFIASNLEAAFEITEPAFKLFSSQFDCLVQYEKESDSGINDRYRFILISQLGESGSEYRNFVYHYGIGHTRIMLSAEKAIEFLEVVESILRATLFASRRKDGLYHAYNVLNLGENTASIEHLDLMLEGQVAILSSGVLTPEESLELLINLRQSPLYRADQHSYTLYPDRDLPGFLKKNVIAPEMNIELFNQMVANHDQRLVNRDIQGTLHFNGQIHNERDVKAILNDLSKENRYGKQVSNDRDKVLSVFERVFHHNAFTGRSGTFFAYEGLGSIYWHMVTKLLLAAQECLWRSFEESQDDEVSEGLRKQYYDIRSGIGFNKNPSAYGSFPMDPYSHTPAGAGAKQPGMTGQVKEELMTRWRELGVVISNGKIHFTPKQIQQQEFLQKDNTFKYIDIHNTRHQIYLKPGSLAFTFCQVPIVYHKSKEAWIELHLENNETKTIDGIELSISDSSKIFNRKGDILRIDVYVC